ncbi:PilZ domain-containing protein [Haliangium sp.]|uniref:PilZ domain-containing protein n=1 Tax=Haliangium sp. TaxID=2663208 RepID=UPI003D0E3952
MIRVDVRLADKAEWVKLFDPRDCTLFVPNEEPPEVGTSMRIDLVVGDSGPRVLLRGTVMRRHEAAEAGFPAGCLVALGAREREKINYLNGFVRGGLLDLRARRRLPLRLPVTYGGINGPEHSHIRDINEEGVFVLSDNPLPEESRVHLLISVPDRDEPLSLHGHVSHTVVAEDDDVPGMGIVFDEADRGGALPGIIDALEEAFLSGALPEDVLS